MPSCISRCSATSELRTIKAEAKAEGTGVKHVQTKATTCTVACITLLYYSIYILHAHHAALCSLPLTTMRVGGGTDCSRRVSGLSHAKNIHQARLNTAKGCNV